MDLRYTKMEELNIKGVRKYPLFYGGNMLEKPKRPKQFNNQEMQIPDTIENLINRYDLENKEIYEFLDYLVKYLNERGI